MKKILEGSRAVALTVKNIKPEVISAYPITPQTHIVEDLAQFKADGTSDYEYIRAESEFAAASIIEGASATGSRVYSATSSQGLLLMNEVIYNIAGMRLPVVMTIANRGVSGPITIWNDHQDAMSIRDAGWIMLFAENHQEAVYQHLLAYKIAEATKLPVNVNIDGFILTHSYEPVIIPTKSQVKKFLPKYSPKSGTYLDPDNPITMGAFASPAYYQEIRQDLHQDLINSLDLIEQEYKNLKKSVGKDIALDDKSALVEYYGDKQADTVIIAMGSVVGTIKDIVDKNKKVAVLKIKTFRPFPAKTVLKHLTRAKYVAVFEKAVSLGSLPPLAQEIKTRSHNQIKAKIKSFVSGLGGRDITKKKIHDMIKQVRHKKDRHQVNFLS